MTRRNQVILIASGVLLIVAFLGGFIPQYRRANRLEAELNSTRARTGMLEANAQLSTLESLASSMYLQATRMNYGNASRIATEFFSKVRRLQSETTDAATRRELEQIAGHRDTVVAALARGDSAAVGEIQQILESLLELLRRQPA
jgi:hypothetical protein